MQTQEEFEKERDKCIANMVIKLKSHNIPFRLDRYGRAIIEPYHFKSPTKNSENDCKDVD